MIIDDSITHIGFSDESNWNMGKYRSLGFISMALSDFNHLSNELTILLQESDINEFMWKKLRTAKYRYAALKMCDFTINYACQSKLRIDVLLWDTDDQRHKVRHRDDTANLERMYYHLFKYVLKVHWPDDARWKLVPDEHSSINWGTIQECLEFVSRGISQEHSIFNPKSFRLRLKYDFHIDDISEGKSGHHSILQLIDLFAGLAVFSYTSFSVFKQWFDENSPQVMLFESASENVKHSGSTIERFQVLSHFNDRCKQRRLGVSLNRKKGLWTPNPNNPINFWHYIPQHPDDKAPIKC